MSGFRAAKDGTAVATFTAEEAGLLADLARQVAQLVEGRGVTGSDPALDRLLPDAYNDNDEHAAEFRRFTETELADGKVHNAGVVADSLAQTPGKKKVEVSLDADATGAWLRTLTDIRLTLAARVGIVDESEPHPRDESEEMLLAIYEWLGYQLESLLQVIDR